MYFFRAFIKELRNEFKAKPKKSRSRSSVGKDSSKGNISKPNIEIPADAAETATLRMNNGDSLD